LFSSGGLLLGELGSSLLLGLGKSTAAIAMVRIQPIFCLCWSCDHSKVASLQTTRLAVRRRYLERGCTWGQLTQHRNSRDSQSGGTEYILYRLTGVGATARSGYHVNRCLSTVAPTTDFACICKLLLITRFTRIVLLGKVSITLDAYLGFCTINMNC